MAKTSRFSTSSSIPKPTRPRKRRKSSKPTASASSPVVTSEIDYQGHVPPISLSPSLGDLLFPLDRDDFLREHFRQKAVHVTCAQGRGTEHQEIRTNQLCKEMCNLNVETIIRESSSDSIFVWLRRPCQNGSAAHDDKIQSIEVADPETAIALHKTGGHATYCRAPPTVEQNLVSSLLRETGLGCGQYDPSGESIIAMARGEVETFVSTEGHVTNWHFDFQENFTIQLSGIKRWTLQQGSLQDPVRGCTPHYAAPEAVESQLKAAHLHDPKFSFGYPQTGTTAMGGVVSIDVKPGDVLYFPAGMWHKVETVEPGVSINVSLMASTYASITCNALHHALMKNPHWRQPVLSNSALNAVEHLKELLNELPVIIQSLQGVGAECIIPPILQYPPKFEALNFEMVEEEVENGEEKTEEEEYEQDSDERISDPSADSQQADVVSMEDSILDPCQFDGYPDGYEIPDLEGNVIFATNPLACLHRMTEITSHYRNETATNQVDENDVYVLNVNYAGNEMHQSAVRVVFRDTSGDNFVHDMYLLQRGERESASGEGLSEERAAHVKFLAYHGYLQICYG